MLHVRPFVTSILAVILFSLPFTNPQSIGFAWSVVDGSNATYVPECSKLTIKPVPTENGTFNIKPPLTMFMVEVIGLATVDPLTPLEGKDDTVTLDAIRHPQGTFVVAYVVDSVGNLGNATLLGITNGSSECYTKSPPPIVAMELDKQQVQPCEFVTLNLFGGRMPYTITVISGGLDTLVMNMTMGPNDDTFYFLNELASGQPMIFSATDSDGQRSLSSPIIQSVGLPQDSCDGKQSYSTSSKDSFSNSSSHRRARIIAVLVGIVGALLLVLALNCLVVMVRRRRRRILPQLQKPLDLSKEEADPFQILEPTPFTMEACRIITHELPLKLQQLDAMDHTGNTTREVVLLSKQDHAEAALYRETRRHPNANPRTLTNPVSALATEHQQAEGAVNPVINTTHLTPILIEQEPTRVEISSPLTTNTERRTSIPVGISRQRAIIQHVDVEDAIELPPAYKERSIQA